MIDVTKPIETRDGRPVRILCTDAKNSDFPIVGLVTEFDGQELVYSWSVEGLLILDEFNQEDIINVGVPE